MQKNGAQGRAGAAAQERHQRSPLMQHRRTACHGCPLQTRPGWQCTWFPWYSSCSAHPPPPLPGEWREAAPAAAGPAGSNREVNVQWRRIARRDLIEPEVSTHARTLRNRYSKSLPARLRTLGPDLAAARQQATIQQQLLWLLLPPTKQPLPSSSALSFRGSRTVTSGPSHPARRKCLAWSLCDRSPDT